ncbi:MAG: hypothetical protein MK510_05455 [SAR324 cluster bacterium]|nr:hypothetical protein [SAR324 cluster bacterium]
MFRTDDCENSGIGQLNTKVEGLVLKIIEEDKISHARKKITAEVDTQTEKSPSEDNTWHYVAVSVTLVSALMSYNASNSYNDLSAKNSTLATQYANSSSSEKAAYKSEYDSNASQINRTKAVCRLGIY